MLCQIQVFQLTLLLQAFVGPTLGAHINGSLVLRELETRPEPGTSIRQLPVGPGSNFTISSIGRVSDNFDAFQESFASQVIDFDDDTKDYTDDEYVDTDQDLLLKKIVNKEFPANELEHSTKPDALTKIISFGEPVEPKLIVEINIEPKLAEPASVSSSEPTVVQSTAAAGPSLAPKAVVVAEFPRPALLSQICRSQEFQPTLENWWVSGADQWLKNYTAENKNSPAFRAFGLVDSITQQYLGSVGLRCSINPKEDFRPDICRISCLDVVARVNDIEVAKKVFFVLAGVIGLSERIGGIYNAAGQVAQGVAKLAEEMPTERGLNTTVNKIGDILFNSIDGTLFAASPWIPTEKIYQAGYETLQAAKHHYDMAVQASFLAANQADPYKWDKAFDSSYKMSLAEIDFAPKGYAEGTTPIPGGMKVGTWYNKAVSRTQRALEDARALVVFFESGSFVEARNDGFELFKELLAYSPNHPKRAAIQESGTGVKDSLGLAASRAKVMLAGVLDRLLRGDGSSLDGTTDLSKLLRYGHYLPSGPGESISKFRKADIAEIITRDVFMELFDRSLRQQSIYISCTEDKQQRANPRTDFVGPRVDSCHRDNTGPQNLKACFGNMVCYLYEWDERPMSHMSRNKAPHGHQEWDEKPWSIEPQDIILSSVATYLTKDFSPKDTAGEADFYYESMTLDTLRDARSPNHFKIPVCMSTHNWNTRLDGWNTFCDTSKHCVAKSLPCQCGASGKDTQFIWEAVGIWNSPQHNHYSATLCPRQIQKKIGDPLERYVAYCNLGIKRRGMQGSRVDGFRRYQGKDKYCDVITKTVESQKNGLVSDLDPETRFMFLCQINKGGRGCSMYQKTFDRLWEAVQ